MREKERDRDRDRGRVRNRDSDTVSTMKDIDTPSERPKRDHSSSPTIR